MKGTLHNLQSSPHDLKNTFVSLFSSTSAKVVSVYFFNIFSFSQLIIFIKDYAERMSFIGQHPTE